jgi:chorismate mutase / prephenate dehydratase
MQEIDKLRSEIDQIHVELARLFKQRLALTKKIWEIKKAKKLPFFDKQREDAIIHQFDSSTSDNDEQIAMQSFFKCILTETRKYLEAKLK